MERESTKEREKHFEKAGVFFSSSISLPGTCLIINRPDDSAGVEADRQTEGAAEQGDTFIKHPAQTDLVSIHHRDLVSATD